MYSSLSKHNENGENTISLLIKGVHCAACISKIEGVLTAYENVKHVRLNFSTGRLNITWSGSTQEIEQWVKEIEHLGYDVFPFNIDNVKDEDDKQSRALLLCLGVAGFAAGNIMLLSVGLWVSTAESMGFAMRGFLHWISALIAIPAILFAGQPFFKSAWIALKNKRSNMDVPISVALVLATGMSLFETITHGEHVYFDSAVMLMFFLLIGRYLDFRARRSAKSAATDLLQTLNGLATIIDQDGAHKTVFIKDLKPDMRVIVAVGEAIPIDGIIEKGKTQIDTSLVTGETLLRSANEGENVFAGTVNMDAPIVVTVSMLAEDSLLSDIVKIMETAEQSNANYVRFADRAARLYTPVVHTLAVLAFCMWFFMIGAPWQTSLLISITVLIITCPCALGLAVPVVQVLASSKLYKKGILLKSGDALERLAKIDSIVFDKTGTLTHGHPSLIGEYDEQHLILAQSLATHSKHPLSKSLHKNTKNPSYELKQIKEHAGKGLSGVWDNKKVKLGSRNWAGDKNAPSADHMELWLNIDGKPVCCFNFTDELKDDAKEVIGKIKERFSHYLLSGDRQSVVDSIADKLGLETAHGELNPLQKHDYLQDLKSRGHTVLMIGDGLNDAPVLAAADVSMAPGTAIDIAQNAADIVFMGDKLTPILTTLKTAQDSQRLIKQNFTLAALYNLIAIPLAFMGLVTPMVAALAMSGSSLLVIANSFRLKFMS